jgi:sugar lactone lactonase YvrE
MVLLGLSAVAQFDPSKRWFTTHSEHFTLHFEAGLEGVVPEVMRFAEEAYGLLKKEFEWAPQHIALTLTDPGDLVNSFANPVFNEVGIYTIQFRQSEFFNPRLESWWQAVVFHELVHAIEMSRPYAASGLRWLSGANVSKPIPFIEGLAVYEKFKHLGESRLNDSRTRMIIRQMVLDQSFPTWNQIRQPYSKSDWPTSGFLAYNYAAWFMHYLELSFGSDALLRLARVNVGYAPTKDFDWPFRQTFGLSLEEAYAGFLAWLPSQFEAEIAQIKGAGITQAETVSKLGFFSDTPLSSKLGLIYAHGSPSRVGIRLIAEGERELLSGNLNPLDISADGRYLLYNRSGEHTRFDLYRYDLDTLERKLVSAGSRIYAARFSPDGRRAYVARNLQTGDTELAQLELDTGELKTLYTFPNTNGTVHSLAISPDGTAIAVSLLKRGGFQDLYVAEIGKPFEALTQDRSVDADPVFSADGQYVLYSADLERRYNLYAVRLWDRTHFQVTNLLTGAFTPALSRDGQHLYFTGFDGGGYNIYRIPYSPQSWKKVERKPQTIPSYQPPKPIADATPYNPFAYLRPKLWLPQVLSDGAALGAIGSDPVGLHEYAAALGFSASQGILYAFSYTFAGLGRPITVEASGTGLVENRQGLSVEFGLPNFSGPVPLSYTREATQTEVRHALSSNLQFSSASAVDLSRSSTTLTLVPTVMLKEGDPTLHYDLRAKLAYQWRLPLQNPHFIRWSIGGALSDFATYGLGVGLLYSPSLLGIRFNSTTPLQGRQVMVGNLEYSLPLLAIEQGLGNWPFFFDDLRLTLFVQAAAAGTPLRLEDTRYALGAELNLSTQLSYSSAGLPIGLGATYSLDGRFSVYLSLGSIGF